MGMSISSVAGEEGAEDEFPMHVVTRFRAREGAGDLVLRALADVRLLDRTRAADGCRFAAVLQETEDVAAFALVEVFSTYEALRAHAASPVVAECDAALVPLLEDGGLVRDTFLPIAEQNLLSYASAFGGARHSSDSVFCLTEFTGRDIQAATEVKTAVEDARLVEESRKEDGVLYFTFAQHIERKRSFVIVEEYRDLKAFDEHTDTPHMAAAIQALAPHLVDKPRYTTFQHAPTPRH